ncbi:hypothetical protein RRG08_037266 [Elysia crispata]|uniref:Uncharacterized protein n=1 Tax=Elysia crispata TaxID=231223 RepID=A0AAE0XX73_9GAST|nr:hypothetical protein RRG08_037266 [Elysia crispata]
MLTKYKEGITREKPPAQGGLQNIKRLKGSPVQWASRRSKSVGFYSPPPRASRALIRPFLLSALENAALTCHSVSNALSRFNPTVLLDLGVENHEKFQSILQC